MTAFRALPELRFSDWKNLDAHLVWIYEGAPRIASGISGNNCYTAWYLRRGKLTLQEREDELKAGQWVIIPPGICWRRFSPGARILSISFRAHWVTGQRLFIFDKSRVFDNEQTSGWLTPAKPMLRIVRRYYPATYSQLPVAQANYAMYAELQGSFQRWMSHLWQGLQAQGVEIYLPPFDAGRPLEMKRWIDTWPVDQPFRLSSLAKAFNLSVTQTNRLFCEAFETTPKRYFGQRRLAYVKSLMRASSYSIKEVSSASGFRHVSEFSAWFRKQTGQCPSGFRQCPTDNFSA